MEILRLLDYPTQFGCMQSCLVTQLYLTLCHTMDCSPTGSSVHGIFQARILEWLPFPTPGGLPDSEIEPASLSSPTLASGFFTTEPPGKPSVQVGPI